MSDLQKLAGELVLLADDLEFLDRAMGAEDSPSARAASAISDAIADLRRQVQRTAAAAMERNRHRAQRSAPGEKIAT